MITTYTKNRALILPDQTVQQLTATLNTDIATLEGISAYQAIAGAALTQYQAIYLAAYALGTITATPATSGGSLADGTYKARIVANIPFGPNIASLQVSTFAKFLATTEVTFTISGGLGAGSCTLSWGAVNGAVPDANGVTYQIWVTQVGGASGSENYFFTTTGISFIVQSTSTGGTSGTIPTAVMPAQWQVATDTVPTLPDQIYICTVAGAAGTVCYGEAYRIITNSAWNFTPNGLIYVPATAGPLTQTAPTSASVAIGKAGSPTEFIPFVGPRSAALDTDEYEALMVIPSDPAAGGGNPTTSVQVRVTRAGSIVAVKSSCRTAVVTGTYTFDVLKGGSTIYTTTGNRPTRANADGTTLKTHTQPDITAVAKDDLLQLTFVTGGTGISDMTLYVVIDPTGF